MSISILFSMVDEVNSDNFTGRMIAEHIPTPTLTHPLLLPTLRLLKTLFVPVSAKNDEGSESKLYERCWIK